MLSPIIENHFVSIDISLYQSCLFVFSSFHSISLFLSMCKKIQIKNATNSQWCKRDQWSIHYYWRNVESYVWAKIILSMKTIWREESWIIYDDDNTSWNSTERWRHMSIRVVSFIKKIPEQGNGFQRPS